MTGTWGIDARFLAIASNTLVLGILAALIVVCIAALLTFGVRLLPAHDHPVCPPAGGHGDMRYPVRL